MSQHLSSLYTFCFNISSPINLYFIFFFCLRRIFEQKLILPVILVCFPCSCHGHISDSHMLFLFTSFQPKFLKFLLELRSFLDRCAVNLPLGFVDLFPPNPLINAGLKLIFCFIKRMSLISYFQSGS